MNSLNNGKHFSFFKKTISMAVIQLKLDWILFISYYSQIDIWIWSNVPYNYNYL